MLLPNKLRAKVEQMKTERQIEDELKMAAQRATENRERRTAIKQSLQQIEPSDEEPSQGTAGEIG